MDWLTLEKDLNYCNFEINEKRGNIGKGICVWNRESWDLLKSRPAKHIWLTYETGWENVTIKADCKTLELALNSSKMYTRKNAVIMFHMRMEEEW